MRTEPLLLLPFALVAGCDAGGKRGDAGDGSVHIAVDGQGAKDRLSVNIPGVDARIALPGLDLSRHVDLDGIRLAPGTSVRTIDVGGHEGEDGGVQLAFSSPEPPAALVDYYRRSAGQAGYGAIAAAPGSLTATKGGKRFALAVAGEGGGSRGTITMGGEE